MFNKKKHQLGVQKPHYKRDQNDSNSSDLDQINPEKEPIQKQQSEQKPLQQGQQPRQNQPKQFNQQGQQPRQNQPKQFNQQGQQPRQNQPKQFNQQGQQKQLNKQISSNPNNRMFNNQNNRQNNQNKQNLDQQQKQNQDGISSLNTGFKNQNTNQPNQNRNRQQNQKSNYNRFESSKNPQRLDNRQNPRNDNRQQQIRELIQKGEQEEREYENNLTLDPNAPICPLCSLGIKNPFTAIRQKESKELCHFDCILKEITTENAAKLGKNKSIYYVGAGKFAVVKENLDKRGNFRSYDILEKIEYEKKED